MRTPADFVLVGSATLYHEDDMTYSAGMRTYTLQIQMRYVANMSARAVPIHEPSNDTGDGLRAFEITDNNGYVLCFGRPHKIFKTMYLDGTPFEGKVGWLPQS